MSRITENPTRAFPRLKVRGFEPISFGQKSDWVVRLPEQATCHSAGFDFFAPEDIVIPPNFGRPPMLVPTGCKAYMRSDEFLLLANRSSNPKKGLLLANSIGVVDADYEGNPDNDGHIMFSFWNVTEEPITICQGDRLGQGIFINHLRGDNAGTTKKRKGGFGSTDI